KMVHNGIEYGLMQLISETYDVAKRGLSYSNEKLAALFSEWNEGRLQSFLVEITAEIFNKKDDETEAHLVDMILDKAKQKGTGKWTSQNAMDLGTAVPTIDAAVSMREISAVKKLRENADSIYRNAISVNADLTEGELENALLFAFVVTYAQGMTQLTVASKEYNYDLDLEIIAKIWRGGCIIRAALLEDIRKAYDKKGDLESLLLDDSFAAQLQDLQVDARKVAAFAITQGIPMMGLAASISYFDAFTTGRLPLNLIQAQRDHFGSHTYERVDKEGIFHTDW
ncbi:MAG: NADP-dependent phosphogluconate dehydrogenase, partial [Bacteroidota bacterium]